MLVNVVSDRLLLVEGGIVTLVRYACRTWVKISHRLTAGRGGRAESRDGLSDYSTVTENGILCM
jgi:hypothetical protein